MYLNNEHLCRSAYSFRFTSSSSSPSRDYNSTGNCVFSVTKVIPVVASESSFNSSTTVSINFLLPRLEGFPNEEPDRATTRPNKRKYSFGIREEFFVCTCSVTEAGENSFSIVSNNNNPWHRYTIIGFDISKAEDHRAVIVKEVLLRGRW